MATALSSAYVLLGKATMSDPPEWSTGVGAIHTLSSLLTCAGCHSTIRDTPHGTPDDSFSLYCDKCQEASIIKETNQEVLKLLMENIKNLTSYVLKAFTRHNSIMDESSDDDSEIEITDIVIVPAPSHTSKAKFVSKLRKFAKNHFDLIVEENSQVKEEIVEEAKSTSKAVVVSSPVNAEHIQIKLQPPKPTTKRSSHVMINGNNVRRDQVIKSTLRPSLTCPFKPKPELKFTDFVVKLEELTPKILTESKMTILKNSGKKSSCRCGNATPTPGKLTCGGQRCPCYISAKACTDCKCKGCRNPHQVNGIKVVRPHLTMQVQNQNSNQNTNNSKYFISTQNSTSKSLTTIRRIQLN